MLNPLSRLEPIPFLARQGVPLGPPQAQSAGPVSLRESVQVRDSKTELLDLLENRGWWWGAASLDPDLVRERLHIIGVDEHVQHGRNSAHVGDLMEDDCIEDHFRRDTPEAYVGPAYSREPQMRHHPLQWNIGTVHR